MKNLKNKFEQCWQSHLDKLSNGFVSRLTTSRRLHKILPYTRIHSTNILALTNNTNRKTKFVFLTKRKSSSFFLLLVLSHNISRTNFKKKETTSRPLVTESIVLLASFLLHTYVSEKRALRQSPYAFPGLNFERNKCRGSSQFTMLEVIRDGGTGACCCCCSISWSETERTHRSILRYFIMRGAMGIINLNVYARKLIY